MENRTIRPYANNNMATTLMKCPMDESNGMQLVSLDDNLFAGNGTAIRVTLSDRVSWRV